MRTLTLSVIMTLLVANFAFAAVFTPPQGSQISATVVAGKPYKATVCWKGFQVKYLERYRIEIGKNGMWIDRIEPTGECTSFDPYEGDRFQLVSPEGWFLNIPRDPRQRTPYSLRGVGIDRDGNPDPCLQLK